MNSRQPALARENFTAALTNLDKQVNLIAAGHHSGDVDVGLAAALMKKAEMEVRLGSLTGGHHNAQQRSSRFNRKTQRLC